MRMQNRQRVQQETAVELERLIKAFENMLPERVYIMNISASKNSPRTETKTVTEDDMWDAKKHGDDSMCCICFEVYSQETGMKIR